MSSTSPTSGACCPRRCSDGSAVALAFAPLAPTKFQTWYLHQAQTHAQHLTDEFVDPNIPTPSERTRRPSHRSGP